MIQGFLNPEPGTPNPEPLSRLRHRDLRRSQRPSVQRVSLLQKLRHRRFRVLIARLLHQRLVKSRIKRLARLRRDLRNALSFQHVQHLIVHELQALLDHRGVGLRRIDRQRTLEIIDHRQKAVDQRAVGVLDRLLLIGFEAAPRVLEIRLRAGEALVELVALVAQLGQLVRVGARRAFLSGIVAKVFGLVRIVVVDGNA